MPENLSPQPENTGNITQRQAIIASENPADKISKIETLYSVSGWTIFWRNFLAGISRALGSIFIYFAFLGIMGAVFASVVMPRLQPIIDTYMKSMQTINQASSIGETFQGFQNQFNKNAPENPQQFNPPPTDSPREPGQILNNPSLENILDALRQSD